jgi:hypothetical protein
MRCSPLALVALASCSGSQPIELPAYAGGLAIDASAAHTLTIDASGNVRVDGVACPSDEAVEIALHDLVRSMHSNSEIAAQHGRVYAPDEPLVVRIDRFARFADAAHWLRETRQRFLMYRTWIAVADEESHAERFLVMEQVPPPNIGDLLPSLDNLENFVGAHRTWTELWAADHSWRIEDPRPAPAWRVTFSDAASDNREVLASSWSEVREVIAQTREDESVSRIEATLRPETPWGEVAPVVGDALKGFDTYLTFTCSAQVEERRH